MGKLPEKSWGSIQLGECCLVVLIFPQCVRAWAVQIPSYLGTGEENAVNSGRAQERLRCGGGPSAGPRSTQMVLEHWHRLKEPHQRPMTNESEMLWPIDPGRLPDYATTGDRQRGRVPAARPALSFPCRPVPSPTD